VSNAPSKPVSFSWPKVGYFSNRPRILRGKTTKNKRKRLGDNFCSDLNNVNVNKSGYPGSSPSKTVSHWRWFKLLLFFKKYLESKKPGKPLAISFCTGSRMILQRNSYISDLLVNVLLMRTQYTAKNED
jgi:hypothetical protein